MTRPARRATAPSAAHRQWAALNPRQQHYLTVFFALDQAAEQEQRQRWHQQHTREPAGTWRWIPYATRHPQAPATPCQQHLDDHGLRDSGAGATLAALVRRGLILTRETYLDELPERPVQLQVRLTTAGRAAVRASQPPTTSPPLAEWLQEALTKVSQAGPDGLAKYEISRSAARRLGPRGLRYIQDARPWSYQLTREGQSALAASEMRGGTTQHSDHS